MNRFFSGKFAVAATLATAALGAATVAQARPNVEISVGFQSGPAYYEPAPAYYDPAPVYVQPRPVYVQPRSVYLEPAPMYATPPVFVSRREVFERPQWGGHDDWLERERAWRHAEWRRRQWREEFRGDDRYHDFDNRKRRHWD